MQIVIDIPENTYKHIQALVRDDYFEHDICGSSMQRIANGTPLPKGHGNLIDGDALLTQGEVMYGKDEQPYLVCTMNTICNALYCDTLIEADRSEDT